MKCNPIVIQIFVWFLVLISCKSTNNINFETTANYEKYFRTTALPAKGVVVIAHGLNTNPLKMGDENIDGTLVKLFLDEGYHVYRIVLPGHEGAIEGMQNLNTQDLLNSARMQYREAAQIARENNLPMYLAAFSLGAVVYKNLLQNEEDVAFAKAILFAPAVAIKRTARAGIFAADFFRADSVIIKSRAPAEYRAQKGVSISAYKALFELEDMLYKNKFANCNIPALVFIDSKDELISVSKLQRLVLNFNLSNWNIVTVSNTGAEITPKYHHLIIDNKSVSPQTWNFIHSRIVHFINEL